MYTVNITFKNGKVVSESHIDIESSKRIYNFYTMWVDKRIQRVELYDTNEEKILESYQAE